MTTKTLPKLQADLLARARELAEREVPHGVYVQGPTYRAAQALVRKDLGTFIPLSEISPTKGWFLALASEEADEIFRAERERIEARGAAVRAARKIGVH